MRFKPVTRVTVHFEPEHGTRWEVGHLLHARQRVHFEYSADWRTRGLELCPMTLPLRPGVFTASPERFDGLHGLFADSLPDGWGRLLFDRKLATLGIDPSKAGPLDRLTAVGSHGIGALVYEPDRSTVQPTVVKLADLARDVTSVFANQPVDLDRLLALGGSPQGARPKALIWLDEQGAAYGGPRADCSAWLVKFAAPDDDVGAGALEYAWMQMARAAGIDVPETRLLSGSRQKHFAIRRFDVLGARRVHQLSLASLLDAPPAQSVIDYRDFLLATRQLTRHEADVTEAFRRACFNVLAHNRDDHARNSAYLMNAIGEWRLSPAFDLTFSRGPSGHHWMPVDGESALPGAEQLMRLAERTSVKNAEAVLREVQRTVARVDHFCADAGVPKRIAQRVRNLLTH